MIMPERAGMRALPAAGWVSRRPGLGDSGSHVPRMYLRYASHVPPMDVPDNAGLRCQSRIGCFPVQLLIISEPDGERRLGVRPGVERPGGRCVIPGAGQVPGDRSGQPGRKASAVAAEPPCMVCMVMDLVAGEQCDGRQRAGPASLPVTG